MQQHGNISKLEAIHPNACKTAQLPPSLIPVGFVYTSRVSRGISWAAGVKEAVTVGPRNRNERCKEGSRGAVPYGRLEIFQGFPVRVTELDCMETEGGDCTG